MSWSFSISAGPRDQFDAAVDAAVATGQPASTPGLAEDVAAAKSALKIIAGRVKKSKVGGSASGHCMIPGEEKTHSDHVGVNVFGSDD